MDLQNFKIVSKETVKVVIIIACVVILCANMFFMAKFNEVDRGLDAVFDISISNHQELINKLDNETNRTN